MKALLASVAVVVLIPAVFEAPLHARFQVARPSCGAAAPEQCLSAEQLMKVRAYALTQSKDLHLPVPDSLRDALGLGSGLIEAEGLGSPTVKGPDFISFLIKPGSDDVIVMFTDSDRGDVWAWLTDSSRVLRTAAMRNQQGIHVYRRGSIGWDDAAAAYARHLQVWADVSRGLR